MKCDGRLGCDKTGRFHLFGPEPVVCCDNKLRLGKMRLQEPAELIAVASVNRHNDVIQERERELVAEQSLHKSQIEANPHAVLMAFAVVGAGRKEAPFVEINVEVELSSAGR